MFAENLEYFTPREVLESEYLKGKLLYLRDFFLHNAFSGNTIARRGTSFTTKTGNEYGQTKLVYDF